MLHRGSERNISDDAVITHPRSKTGMNFAVLTISYLLRPYGNAFRIYLDQMKKGLCEPNRYEITVKIPEKAIKTRWKAEKPVRRANFVSKWYVIHRKNLAQAGFFQLYSPAASYIASQLYSAYAERYCASRSYKANRI